MLSDPIRDLLRGRMMFLEAVTAALPGNEEVDDRISRIVSAKIRAAGETDLPVE